MSLVGNGGIFKLMNGVFSANFHREGFFVSQPGKTRSPSCRKWQLLGVRHVGAGQNPRVYMRCSESGMVERSYGWSGREIVALEDRLIGGQRVC